jgi:predicted ATPase
MYGRENDLRLLMEVFREVQLTGNSEVCIVSGFSGAGKTSLVREALEQMTQEGALAATAKFNQFNPDVPHTSMVRALSPRIKVDLRSNAFTTLPGNCFSLARKISTISSVLSSMLSTKIYLSSSSWFQSWKICSRDTNFPFKRWKYPRPKRKNAFSDSFAVS